MRFDDRQETEGDTNMSIQDLIHDWEEALARSFSQLDDRDAIAWSERDLEVVAGVAIRSNIHAGWTVQPCEITCIG